MHNYVFLFFSFLAPGREDKHIGVIRDINNSLLWGHVKTMKSIPWKVGHWDCEMKQIWFDNKVECDKLTVGLEFNSQINWFNNNLLRDEDRNLLYFLSVF